MLPNSNLKFVAKALGVSCSLCDQPMNFIAYSCPSCEQELYRIRLKSEEGISALFSYEAKTKRLIFSLRGEEFLAPKKLILRHLKESGILGAFPHCQLLTLIPSNQKIKQRGLVGIGEEIALQLGLEFNPNLLVKTRKHSQHEQIAPNRLDALLMIKVQHPSSVLGKNILLLDDVSTTGTSIDQGVFALKKAGAHQVHPFSLAFTKRAL